MSRTLGRWFQQPIFQLLVWILLARSGTGKSKGNDNGNDLRQGEVGVLPLTHLLVAH